MLDQRLKKFSQKISFVIFILWPIYSLNVWASEKSVDIKRRRNWEVKLDSKYFFASNTTYQFGDPNTGSDKPLSRLEFPINNLWMGGELRRNFPRCSIGVHVLSSVMHNTYGRMKDSDWDNPDDLDERTIFSTSACRMDYGLMAGGDIDLKILDRFKLPRSLDLRPLIGFEWQRFSFMAHDGLQHEYNPPAPDKNFQGNTLQFFQNYWQYFVGLRSSWNMGRPLKLPPLKLLTEVHCSYVTGYNKDHHLLRGDRYTFENTSGWGFYGSLGLETQLTKNITLDTGVDYLMIRTTGTHRWYDGNEGADETWSNGVKVWSDQIGIKLNLAYRF